MNNTDTGGPAFPEFDFVVGRKGVGNFTHAGMTLRDYFAAKAMQALIDTGCLFADFAEMAALTYKWADAMLEARKS